MCWRLRELVSPLPLAGEVVAHRKMRYGWGKLSPYEQCHSRLHPHLSPPPHPPSPEGGLRRTRAGEGAQRFRGLRFVLTLAVLACALPGTASAAPRIISMNICTDQLLLAIADPARFPAAGARCSNPDVPTAVCVASGYNLVPQPAVLANVALNGSMVYTEPALANGKVYASTEAGRAYMLLP